MRSNASALVAGVLALVVILGVYFWAVAWRDHHDDDQRHRTNEVACALVDGPSCDD